MAEHEDMEAALVTSLVNTRHVGAARGLVAVGFRAGWKERQATIDRLTRERDEARDLAFRAAFAPEEGGYVQNGRVMDRETIPRPLLTLDQEGATHTRTVGPWKPVAP